MQSNVFKASCLGWSAGLFRASDSEVKLKACQFRLNITSETRDAQIMVINVSN